LAGLDDLVRGVGNLRYDFEAERHPKGILLQGRLEWEWDCDCARCLSGFRQKIALDAWARMLPWEGEDAVQPRNDCVDLTPYLREDMVLELPQRPLCRPDCSGLPDGSPSSARSAKAPRSWGSSESAWQELDGLRFD
jgi:uncharacterized protein